MTNSVGTSEFEVKFDSGRRCTCDKSSSSSSSSNSNAEISSDVKPLLNSCLALGSSLLETYLPDGNRRPSSDSEAEFERKVENFFRQASCNEYGREMLKKYRKEESDVENIFTRGSGSGAEVIWHKLDPTNNAAVIKTKGKDENEEPDLIRVAQEVVKNAENTGIDFPS